jgi:hypothetical protein
MAKYRVNTYPEKVKVIKKAWKIALGDEECIILRSFPRNAKRFAWFDSEVRITEEEIKAIVIKEILKC